MFKPLASLFHRFGTDTRGSVSVEFVIITPILFWVFMATYVFFDGYRQGAQNLKAAYAIADMISRETEAINDDYIDSMEAVLQLMTRVDTPLKLMVTVVRWDEDDNRYYVDWSESRDHGSERTNSTISDIADKLPVMPDNERVILVETEAIYVPAFDVGVGTRTLDNFVFTRPRFAPQVVWSDS